MVSAPVRDREDHHHLGCLAASSAQGLLGRSASNDSSTLTLDIRRRSVLLTRTLTLKSTTRFTGTRTSSPFRLHFRLISLARNLKVRPTRSTREGQKCPRHALEIMLYGSGGAPTPRPRRRYCSRTAGENRKSDRRFSTGSRRRDRFIGFARVPQSSVPPCGISVRANADCAAAVAAAAKRGQWRSLSSQATLYRAQAVRLAGQHPQPSVCRRAGHRQVGAQTNRSFWIRPQHRVEFARILKMQPHNANGALSVDVP